MGRTVENATAELLDRLIGRTIDQRKRSIIEAAVKEALKDVPVTDGVPDSALWEIEQRLISTCSMVDYQQAKRQCPEHTPSGFAGHWKEWHRGHGCNRDDGRIESKK